MPSEEESVRTRPLLWLFPALLALVLSASLAASSAVAAPASAIRYAYDDAGRLRSVVDPASQSAIFKWDVVGNLLSITRRPSASVQVLQATPSRGPVGLSVRIAGTGFSTTPAQNTVKFNGTAASVQSATATELVATVPTGATTGPIAVVAPGGTGTNDEPFTVTPQTGPIVTGATPRILEPGAQVTVTGSRFDTRPNTTVMFNKTPGLTSAATATSVSALVPVFRSEWRDAPGSGPLSVVTPEGETAGPDVFIAPWGYKAAQVDQTARMQIGQSRVQSFTQDVNPRVGLTVFDAPAGQRVALNVTSAAMAGIISLQHPKGNSLSSTNFGGSAAFSEPVTLATAGTYTAVTATNGWGGDVQFDLIAVPDDTVDTVGPTPQGATKTLATTGAGQNARLRFEGSAGQRIAFRTNSFGGPTTMCASLIGPAGDAVISKSCGNGPLFYGPAVLPDDGTYEIVYDPAGMSTFTASATVYDVPADVETTITPSDTGGTATATNTSPGQDVLVRFDGVAGERVALKVNSITGYTNSKVRLSVRGPGGNEILAPAGLTSAACCSWLDPVTLPADGQYTIVVDPWDGADVGSVGLTAYTVAADTPASVSPSEQGAPVSTSTTVAGQNSRLTFSGTQGHRLGLLTTSSSYSTPVCLSVLNPDGSELQPVGCYSGAGGWSDPPVSLPAAGEYTILVDPQGESTGSFGMTVYDVPADPTATLVPSSSGDTATLATTAPGQDLKFEFQAASDDLIAYKVVDETFPDYPEQAFVSMMFPNSGGGGGSFLVPGFWQEPVDLSADGLHGVRIDPRGTITGSATVRVFRVPPDVSAVIPGIAQPASLSTSAPGQNGRFTFDGTMGWRLDLEVYARTYPALMSKVSVGRPNDKCRGLVSPTTSSQIRLPTLPSQTTYCIAVDPQTDATGGLTVLLRQQCCGLAAAGLNRTADEALPAEIGEPMGVEPTSTGSIAGMVRGADGGRLAGVPVYAGRAVARTDRRGRFVLGSLRAGRHTVRVGDEAFVTRRRYARTSQRITVVAGRQSQLPQLRLARIGRVSRLAAHLPISGAFELRPGHLAGLGISVPAGTRPRSARSGSLALNVARLAEPGALGAPRGVRALAYIDDMDASGLSNPVRVTLPNAGHAVSGARVALLSHLPGRGWKKIGLGTVTPDAKTIVPSSSAALPSLDAAVLGVGKTVDVPAPRAIGVPRHRATHSGGSTVASARALRRFEPRASARWTPTPSNRQGNWVVDRRPSPWSNVAPLDAPDGQTALAGQALKLNGLPLADVSMSIEGTGALTRTDRSGRFLLRGLDAGHHVLVIDGATAMGDRARYGRFEAGVDLERGKTTQLDYTIWMSPLSRAGAVEIDNPTSADVVVKTPHIPGLEVHVPAGSKVRDADGKPVDELSITPVPVDRPPFPLPPHVEVPIYFTVQPGGAYLSKGARIIYPNYNHLPAGQRVAFWNYDPDGRGWHIYGRGSVSDDAAQVVPDPGVRVWELTGAMITGTPMPPGWYPTPDGIACCDPVDLATGLFVYEKTDLSVPDAIPINVTRTYRPSDSNSYAFGVGSSNPYDLRLWSVNNYHDTDLILPDGSRIHYVRTSPGTDFIDAVYETDSAPGPFYKSIIRWNGGGWDLRLKDGTIYAFGEFAPLQSIRDRYGNLLEIERQNVNEFNSGVGNITKITAPHGRFVKFTYDTSNRVTQAVDNAGRTVIYTYNTAGRLATSKDPNGGTTTYSYNTAGQMTSIKDPRAITYVTNVYDANGRVTKQTLGDGGVYTFAYTLDGSGKVTKTRVTDPLNRVRDITFNGAGYPMTDASAVGTPVERNVSYQRQAGSNLISNVTDELNRTTSYEYDSVGNVTQITELAGAPQARITKFAYERVADDYQTNTYRLTSITDPLEHTTTYGHDAIGRLTSVRDATGRETVIGYARADQQPTSITDAAGNTTQFDYQGNGDPASVKDPLGNETSLVVDGAGRPTTTIDALGRRTRYTYDAANGLTKLIDPVGQSTLFERDPNGNVTKVTDARLKTRVMTYDPMDRLATVTDGLNRVERYEYDKTGNLIKLTDRKGQITSFNYDQLNRRSFTGFGTVPATNKTPTTYASTTSYTWDGGDRLAAVNDSIAGDYVNAFDGFDRLSSAAGPTGTVGYGFDAADRRTSMTISGQAPVTYTYDEANRLSSLARGGNTVSMGYDSAGRRSSVTLPNGISQSYGYDDASRLTGITYKLGQATLGDLNYELNPLSQRTAMWGSFARIGMPAAMGSATYDNANQRVTQDGATLTYDANGNLTKDASAATFTWNPRNQLATLAKGATIGSFAYDPYGRRKSKTINGTATSFLHDGQNIVQEQSAGGSTANMLTDLNLDRVFSRTTSTGTSHFLTDGSGSTLALADPLGWIGTMYTYDPFGGTTQSGAANDNSYQYTGRENDGTSLYHYRARYHHPGMARFVSPDPLGLGGGDINLYSYVGGDPINGVDPLGLSIFDPLPDFVGEPLEDGTDWAGARAHEATVYWADVANNSGNPIARGVANVVAGPLAAFGDTVLNSDIGFGAHCGSSYFQRASSNFLATNTSVPGLVAPTGAGFLTSGATADLFNTSTVGRWLVSGKSVSDVFTVARAVTVNAALVAGTWESGVGIGSLAGAALNNRYDC
jgi:RHS repeat-associated protein